MIEAKELNNKELLLDDSVKQNKRGEAILGRLYGPCADIIHATRNGRKYPEKVWETVFNNEIINEFFEAGGLLGELDHPEDRIETCTEKVAICMPEKPKKDKDGHLVAYFDILDTPNGRIAYTLARYGYKLGISSRGDGDVFENYNGEEEVDAKTFDLRGFDLVLLPAVKAARLKMVESLQKSFKQALTEALKSSSPDERKVQEETLNHLGIDYKEKEEKEEMLDESKQTTANDDGVDVINQLQESLKQNKTQEQKIVELQEKLSVCYAKEVKLNEELNRYKQTTISLSESAKTAKGLNLKVKQLEESLNQSKGTIDRQRALVNSLREKHIADKKDLQRLNERLESETQKNVQLTEDLKRTQEEVTKQIQALKENLEEVKQNSAIKAKEYSQKLSNANKLVEHCKSVANIAINRYIDFKAKTVGATSAQIKNRLNENYTFNDIDRVCESLSEYKLNISKLPFRVSDNNQCKMKVKVTESVEPIKKGISHLGFDDEVDAALLNMAELDDEI